VSRVMMPKTLIAVLAAGLVGFVLCAFVGKDKMMMTEDPLLNSLLNGLVGGFGASAFVAYIASIVICGLKDKPFFVVMGVLTLIMPAFSLWPVIGAIRIAKPNSTWARKYYGEEKMQIARARFTKSR
jgi:hypothetical protein